jgi:hypothetical protein
LNRLTQGPTNSSSEWIIHSFSGKIYNTYILSSEIINYCCSWGISETLIHYNFINP